MRYLKVMSNLNQDDVPVTTFHEVDDDDFESKKIEIYPDSTIEMASYGMQTKESGLSPEKFEAIDEINALQGFDAAEIAKEEFERQWDLASNYIRNK
ncbi:hypothetical protein [Mesorhizobium sp. M0244]|uniref:DUF6881 domain-containing protein n=1 Tax=Mesorhizobium sp. M0244 TaxID=2956926 RepID=UPI003336FF74